jgi:hypothetical protein
MRIRHRVLMGIILRVLKCRIGRESVGEWISTVGVVRDVEYGGCDVD